MKKSTVLDRPLTITVEQGYSLVQRYVQANYGKYFTVAEHMSSEDCVQEIMLKFIEKNLFAKYDREVTSPEYFIAVPVGRWFIDQTRKYNSSRYTNYKREEQDDEGNTYTRRIASRISLDDEIGDGMRLADVIAANTDVEGVCVGKHYRNYIIEELPTDTKSTVLIKHPSCDEKFSLRNLAILLEEGLTPKEITSHCWNPANGKNVSSGRVLSEIKALRQYIRDFIVPEGTLKGYRY